MGEEDFTFVIEQKVAAGLIDIIARVRACLHALAQEVPIKPQGRRGKNSKPGKTFEAEYLIGNPFGIGEQSKRPLVALLIRKELRRFGKRYDGNRQAALVECRFRRLHLSKVGLAGQSSEMAQKDQ